jgi:hypothetical protein
MPSGAVIFTLVVQEADAASDGIVTETEPLPDVAPVNTVPTGQLEVSPGELATTMPRGNVSVNVTPVNAAKLFGLLTTKFTAVIPPGRIFGAVKDLLIDGGATTVMTGIRRSVPGRGARVFRIDYYS